MARGDEIKDGQFLNKEFDASRRLCLDVGDIFSFVGLAVRSRAGGDPAVLVEDAFRAAVGADVETYEHLVHQGLGGRVNEQQAEMILQASDPAKVLAINKLVEQFNETRKNIQPDQQGYEALESFWNRFEEIIK